MTCISLPFPLINFLFKFPINSTYCKYVTLSKYTTLNTSIDSLYLFSYRPAVIYPHGFHIMKSLLCICMLCHHCAFCRPLCTLYYHSILRATSICVDCSVHSGSDLSVSSLPIMHRVIRKLWMDRPTLRQPAGEQCSLNTPLCPQSAGKQYQRGGSTWQRGFHIAPCCLQACCESSLTLTVSLPLITATC